MTLKLLFAGEAYEDAVALFTGQITAWEVWDGEGQITATDDRLARNLLLPQTVVTLATHPNAPEQSIGQALPIVYGSGTTLDPLPLLLVDTLTADYVVSGHENAQMMPAYGAWPLGTDRLQNGARDSRTIAGHWDQSPAACCSASPKPNLAPIRPCRPCMIPAGDVRQPGQSRGR